MTPDFAPVEVLYCAMRPAGSFSYLSSLIGFVVVAWFISPSRRLPSRRAD